MNNYQRYSTGFIIGVDAHLSYRSAPNILFQGGWVSGLRRFQASSFTADLWEGKFRPAARPHVLHRGLGLRISPKGPRSPSLWLLVPRKAPKSFNSEYLDL